MSLNHAAVLEGPKRQDVERGNGSLQPPVPFVPDKSKDAEERTVQTLKIEPANGVESRVAVWEGLGTPERFMQHMIAMRDALKGMGLFKKYEEARKKVSDVKEEVNNEKALRDVVIKQVDTAVLETEKEPLREEVAEHTEAIKVLQAAVATAKQERVAAMATVFATTANFFRGDGKAPWDKIVHEQT
jgi:tetraacyldisaccharide-1-P 4'-kinase